VTKTVSGNATVNG